MIEELHNSRSDEKMKRLENCLAFDCDVADKDFDWKIVSHSE